MMKWDIYSWRECNHSIDEMICDGGGKEILTIKPENKGRKVWLYDDTSGRGVTITAEEFAEVVRKFIDTTHAKVHDYKEGTDQWANKE